MCYLKNTCRNRVKNGFIYIVYPTLNSSNDRVYTSSIISNTSEHLNYFPWNYTVLRVENTYLTDRCLTFLCIFITEKPTKKRIHRPQKVLWDFSHNSELLHHQFMCKNGMVINYLESNARYTELKSCIFLMWVFLSDKWKNTIDW